MCVYMYVRKKTQCCHIHSSWLSLPCAMCHVRTEHVFSPSSIYTHIHTFIHTYTHIYTYIYTCACARDAYVRTRSEGLCWKFSLVVQFPSSFFEEKVVGLLADKKDLHIVGLCIHMGWLRLVSSLKL